MKLVTVLMLTALPLYCYAGAGCPVLEDVINETIDPTVSQTQFMQDMKQYISNENTARALKNFKQCFLNKGEDTLRNVKVMMEAIYNSKSCAGY